MAALSLPGSHGPQHPMTASSRKSRTSTSSAPADPPDADQAHNVWLAGLGALAKAQTEGSKAFDGLVKQGLAWQNQTQEMAKAQLAEAAERIEAMATGASPLGAPRWNALEGIFEKRVANAIARLGLPDAEALERLEARVAALEKALMARDGAPDSGTVATKKRTPAKRAR